MTTQVIRLGTVLNLVSGWVVRVTPYVIEVYPDEDSTTPITYDMQGIVGVRRDGADIRILEGSGSITILEMASIDEAGRLETKVRTAIVSSGRQLRMIHLPTDTHSTKGIFPLPASWPPSTRLIVEVTVIGMLALIVWFAVRGQW